MKQFRVLAGLFLLFAAANKTFAQDFWKMIPDANYGNTQKGKYIVTTPGYMGPNALPVPEFRKGNVSSDLYFQLSGVAHFDIYQDKTLNTFAKFCYPVVPGKVALELYGVPFEQYSQTGFTKHQRRILDENNSGFSWGDLYFSTVLQILKEQKNLPDMALAMTCKTASGNHLLNARFTDAPAYWFDTSFGKDLKFLGKAFRKIRLYSDVGFYVWQTNSEIHRQDDSFLYGLGIEATFQEWQINQVWGGYNGYLNLRDKPCVYRLQFLRQQNRFNYALEYQLGLRDTNSQAFKVSLIYFPFKQISNLLAEKTRNAKTDK